MVQVKVGDNNTRQTVIVDSNTTLRQVFEDAGVDYANGQANLDGTSLKPGDLDKTFADFGVAEHCFLTSVVKTTNA